MADLERGQWYTFFAESAKVKGRTWSSFFGVWRDLNATPGAGKARGVTKTEQEVSGVLT